MQLQKQLELDLTIFYAFSRYAHHESVRTAAYKAIILVSFPTNNESLQKLIDLLTNPLESGRLKYKVIDGWKTFIQSGKLDTAIYQSDNQYNVDLCEFLWNFLNSEHSAFDSRLRWTTFELCKSIWGYEHPSCLPPQEDQNLDFLAASPKLRISLRGDSPGDVEGFSEDDASDTPSTVVKLPTTPTTVTEQPIPTIPKPKPKSKSRSRSKSKSKSKSTSTKNKSEASSEVTKTEESDNEAKIKISLPRLKVKPKLEPVKKEEDDDDDDEVIAPIKINLSSRKISPKPPSPIHVTPAPPSIEPADSKTSIDNHLPLKIEPKTETNNTIPNITDSKSIIKNEIPQISSTSNLTGKKRRASDFTASFFENTGILHIDILNPVKRKVNILLYGLLYSFINKLSIL